MAPTSKPRSRARSSISFTTGGVPSAGEARHQPCVARVQHGQRRLRHELVLAPPLPQPPVAPRLVNRPLTHKGPRLAVEAAVGEARLGGDKRARGVPRQREHGGVGAAL
eukprot:scaffold6278_cov66-Phaeocystis_antarctica.AAC.2